MGVQQQCVFTQSVDDAHGQLNTQEHEGPACSPESPCLHTVVLMFFRKNLLQETITTASTPRTKYGDEYYNILFFFQQIRLN